jgi:hypothetical protein
LEILTKDMFVFLLVIIYDNDVFTLKEVKKKKKQGMRLKGNVISFVSFCL